MNKTKQAWQNINYVYRLFGNRNGKARKRYREFVVKGIAEGRRPDLTGGGLLRRIGGWTALLEFHKAGIRVKGDERILGNRRKRSRPGLFYFLGAPKAWHEHC
jgi:hypothetical protein